jgi:hypothetical protein
MKQYEMDALVSLSDRKPEGSAWNEQEVLVMFYLVNLYMGTNTTDTGCSSCRMEMITNLHRISKEIKERGITRGE